MNPTIKNLPPKIYLQLGEDVDEEADFNDLREVTWCVDKIHETDVTYSLDKGKEELPEHVWCKIVQAAKEYVDQPLLNQSNLNDPLKPLEVIKTQQTETKTVEQVALEYAIKHSSAPDKETPDWIITDFMAGYKYAKSEQISAIPADLWNLIWFGLKFTCEKECSCHTECNWADERIKELKEKYSNTPSLPEKPSPLTALQAKHYAKTL